MLETVFCQKLTSKSLKFAMNFYKNGYVLISYRINITIEYPSVQIVKVEEEVSSPQFVEESKVENLATHCNRRKLEVVSAGARTS